MKRILIDADTGIDDSLAILYALRSPNFHVEGITTCFGNNNAEQSADNSLRLIRLSGCGYEVPAPMSHWMGYLSLLPHSSMEITESATWSCRKAARNRWMRQPGILL